MKKLCFVLLVSSLLVSSCQDIPTTIPSTQTSIPPTDTTVPTAVATDTQEPTATSEPTITPIPVPDFIDQTFSNIQLIYHDDFDYKLNGQTPDHWVTRDGNAVLRITKDDNLRIGMLPNTSGDLFYCNEELITPGKGIYFTFQYTGSKMGFTWGIDNINADHEFYPYKTESYYSFAMMVLNRTLTAHVIEGPYTRDGNFIGDLKLRADTWYQMVIAFDKEKNFLIKISELASPDHTLMFQRNYPNSTNSYYFISWIGEGRTLWMDDFTIFSFNTIL